MVSWVGVKEAYQDIEAKKAREEELDFRKEEAQAGRDFRLNLLEREQKFRREELDWKKSQSAAQRLLQRRLEADTRAAQASQAVKALETRLEGYAGGADFLSKLAENPTNALSFYSYLQDAESKRGEPFSPSEIVNNFTIIPGDSGEGFNFLYDPDSQEDLTNLDVDIPTIEPLVVPNENALRTFNDSDITNANDLFVSEVLRLASMDYDPTTNREMGTLISQAQDNDPVALLRLMTDYGQEAANTIRSQDTMESRAFDETRWGSMFSNTPPAQTDSGVVRKVWDPETGDWK